MSAPPAGPAGQGAAITGDESSGGPELESDSGGAANEVVLPDGAAGAGEPATPNASAAGDDNQFTIPEKPELKYPNPGSMLNQLVARVEAGEASAEDAAADAPVHREASVAVTIYLSGNVDGVVSFLKDNGGSPRNAGGDYIEAYVPVSLLGQTSGNCSALRTGDPLLKKLRKTFTVGIGGHIGLKCDCHADSP